jgi:hypothetical protein
VSVRIQTPEQLAAELAVAGASVGSKVAARTRSATDAIRGAQYHSAPVLTGTTRNSIGADISVRGASVRANIGPTHFVSRFLVFGTVKMSPKWDLFGASQAGMEGWLKDMADVVDL